MVLIITTWVAIGTDQIHLQDQLLHLLRPQLSREARRKPMRRNLSAMTADWRVENGSGEDERGYIGRDEWATERIGGTKSTTRVF